MQFYYNVYKTKKYRMNVNINVTEDLMTIMLIFTITQDHQ